MICGGQKFKDNVMMSKYISPLLVSISRTNIEIWIVDQDSFFSTNFLSLCFISVYKVFPEKKNRPDFNELNLLYSGAQRGGAGRRSANKASRQGERKVTLLNLTF